MSAPICTWPSCKCTARDQCKGLGVRADICDPTQDERVQALVDALRPFSAAVFNDNGDVTISTGHLKRQDWLKLRAALRDWNRGSGDA